MPRLVCRACGRHIYTVAPIVSLSGDELQCRRCGGVLMTERRESNQPLQFGERRKSASR
jgi:hypothetical protein